MTDERPAGIREIAATLGCSEKTIRRYHAKRSIKTFQIGGPHTPIKMARVDLRKLAKKGKC
jgi:predicted transcriptional regulator